VLSWLEAAFPLVGGVFVRIALGGERGDDGGIDSLLGREGLVDHPGFFVDLAEEPPGVRQVARFATRLAPTRRPQPLAPGGG
jgi:hypothetical protein